MRTFDCTCGNRLFFDSTACVNCGRMAGWCPTCNALRGLECESEGHWRCTAAGCNTRLRPCRNYSEEGVCNRMLRAESDQTLCHACRHNRTVPDTAIPGNREKWARLESAKRRLFYTLDLLGLPYPLEPSPGQPLLSFDFKADVILAHDEWQEDASVVQTVYTGHMNGHITINLNEADDLEREKRRIEMNEPHRTLVGHFRHEIAHYYWEMLVRGRCEPAFCEQFGDHHNPDYHSALQRYYNEGPPDDWREHFVSAYASMHPWEDFAETFAVYLDMVAVLDTAAHWRLTPVHPPAPDMDTMLSAYGELGLALNEINREMGLLDLVPEVFTPRVVEKLHFVDRLIREAAVQRDAAAREAEA